MEKRNPAGFNGWLQDQLNKARMVSLPLCFDLLGLAFLQGLVRLVGCLLGGWVGWLPAFPASPASLGHGAAG